MVYEKDKIDFRILGDSNYKLIKGLQQDIYTRNWNEGEIEHLLKKGGGQGLIIYLSKKIKWKKTSIDKFGMYI